MQRALGVVLLLPWLAAAAPPAGDNDRVALETAQEYLKAATGGSSRGKQLLLGGVTMSADLLELDSAEIVSREPVRHEVETLASAQSHIQALDKSGRQALTRLIGKGRGGDDLNVRELTREEAAQIMAPTQEKARRLAQDHPVLAYAVRVDKEVYWHPKNPMRALLQKVGSKGTYTLDLYLFKVRSLEGPTKASREWPLRVLRFRSAKLDTGWKVLPASDWSPE